MKDKMAATVTHARRTSAHQVRLALQLGLRSAAVSLLVIAVLAGCAMGATTAQQASGSPTARVAPPTTTPVPVKAKPSVVPPMTQELCQNLLSLNEANQIITPSIPANTIVAKSDSSGGACNYEYGPLQDDLVLYFTNYNGPVPISSQDIQSNVTALFEGTTVTVTTFTPVTGVGDQAAFLAGTYNPGDRNHKFDFFYVLYGKVAFDCSNTESPSNASDATVMSNLQQCAKLLVSRFPS